MFLRLLLSLPFECAICRKWPSTSFEGTSGVCQNCIQAHANAPLFPIPPDLDACVAALSFDTPWSTLISRYKFAPEPGLAKLFAGLMRRDTRIQKLLADADILLPLPLAPKRLEARGFNQALTLARSLVNHKINAHALIRTRNTSPQRLLDRQARQHNVVNAFAVQTESCRVITGKHVLLIDDVMTTGATLAAAASAVHKAGAAKVSAIVIAQTPLDN